MPGLVKGRHRTTVSKRSACGQGGHLQRNCLRIAARVGGDTVGLKTCLQETGSARANDLRRSREITFAAALTYTPVWAVNGRIVAWNELEQEIENAVRGAR